MHCRTERSARPCRRHRYPALQPAPTADWQPRPPSARECARSPPPGSWRTPPAPPGSRRDPPRAPPQEVAAIHHARHDLLYVVTALGIGGHNIVELVIVARRAAGIQTRRLFQIVVRQKREQPPANPDRTAK